MNKVAACQLKKAAWDIAEVYSREREFNPTNEKFTIMSDEDIVPLSDDLAAVVFTKSSGKRALGLFIHVSQGGGKWLYFFPTDSHLLGLSSVGALKQRVELHNFPLNFREDSVKVKL